MTEERQWIPVAPTKDIESGRCRVIETEDGPIAVFNADGQFYAVDNLCTHEELPLFGCGAEDEEVLMTDGGEVTCPHHGARFCMRTGDALGPPAYEPLRTYPVRVVDGIIQVTID